MRDGAAKGAAGADRMVRDVAHHRRQQPAQRPVHDRTMERRMPHAGADAKLAVLDRQALERGDAVDVDEMRRPRQAECHDRHQALAAGQDAAVLRRHLGQQRDGFVDRLRCVIAERGGLHFVIQIVCVARM